MTAVPTPQAVVPALSYASGDVVAGKYVLEQLLGQGGMGAVFRARNTAIDMPVAIKLVRADLDRQLLSGRLLQEARAAAQLSHPAIVRVFDVGQTALGDPFIVMELLIGESLASLLERERQLPAARALQLLLPIADALSAAHAKGFVHRDVKPDNVFIVDEDGQVQPKLVDFGIVKLEPKGGESQLTQVGAVLGSPEYMSPEQARGIDNVDLRSDVWSFSIVLYETISGATPFESPNYNALLRKIVEDEAPTLHELQVADAALSAIVARGMSKDPAQRWSSLGQMGKALAGWLSDAGLHEDACGTSLEAKWLARTTDPHLARASRSSIPDSWPEPRSGLRAAHAHLANAPTLHAARQASTLHSSALTNPSSAPAAGKRAYQLVVAVVALGALLVGLSQFFSRGPAAPAPAAAPPTTPLPAATLPVISPTPAEPAPVAPEPQLTHPAPRAGVAARPKLAAPGGSPAPARSATAPQQAPASDLLQPY